MWRVQRREYLKQIYWNLNLGCACYKLLEKKIRKTKIRAYRCKSWWPSSSVCVWKWRKWPASCPPAQPAWWGRRRGGPARRLWGRAAVLLPRLCYPPRASPETSWPRTRSPRGVRWSSRAPRMSTWRQSDGGRKVERRWKVHRSEPRGNVRDLGL